MTRHLFFRIFLIAAILFIFSAGVSIVSAEEPVRIGVGLSFSGKYREPSHMIARGYELWARNVNKKGGLLGRPVELIVLDDHSEETRTREIYEHLLMQEEVDLLLSPYSTPLTLIASEIAEQYGKVIIASGASSSRIWERGYQYIFGVYSLADRYFIGYLDLIARQGIRKVSMIFEDSPFNRDAAFGAREWAAKMGVEVQNFIPYAPGKKTIAGILDEELFSEDEALIICSYPDEGYSFLSEIEQWTFRPAAIAMTITPIHPLFAHRAGPIAQGMFAPTQWEPMERIPFPGTQEFIEEFRVLAHTDPSYHAGSAYASCQVLEKAVTDTGSIDNNILREYIMKMDTVTVIGRFKVNNQGMQIGHNPLLIQWQNGHKEIVYPRSMSTAKPVF